MRTLRPLRIRCSAHSGWVLVLALAAWPPGSGHAAGGPSPAPARNVILFVADGLRPGSVTPEDMPNLTALRQAGVTFSNSHALFPTLTTANASAIATGHYLGDTADFGNTLYPGFPIFDDADAALAWQRRSGTVTPFIENDQVLADLDAHFGAGTYLNEQTLLAAARKAGLQTAAIGKLGPVAIQDLDELSFDESGFRTPATLIIDDSTGRPDRAGHAQSPPLPEAFARALAASGLGTVAPERRQSAGTVALAGTQESNAAQQQYFADVTTRVVLPAFKAAGKSFVLVFWSRDPDGSQHNQGDSLNRLRPGINGPTARAGVRDADANLGQILAYIRADPQLAANTDLFVTSDHGFATISKHEIDTQGGVAASYAATFRYRSPGLDPEVLPGWLPPGFLAIDLAHALNLPLFDPDSQVEPGRYRRVDPSGAMADALQHPAGGNGVLGGSGAAARVGREASLIVAANGGSDLVYLPGGDRTVLARAVAFLLRQNYVGGLFVDSRWGAFPGTLPLAAIGLEGSSRLPTPALVVAFRTFPLDPADPLQTAVQISDTSLQEGQGMHGSLGRDNTFNTMSAMGPDFRAGYVDRLPVGNADIAPTLAHILKLRLPAHGQLPGRILDEALRDGTPVGIRPQAQQRASIDPLSGAATVLEYQTLGAQRYFDRACLIQAGDRAQAEDLHCPEIVQPR